MYDDNSDTARHGQGAANLAEADNVEQHFSNSDVRVVAGDYVEGDKHINVTNISPAIRETVDTLRPEDTTWTTKFFESIMGSCTKKFIEKVNEFSWSNVQGKVMENYEDLAEPDKEFYPRIKTEFKLFKGGYVPHKGFSAHCHPEKGRYIDLTQFMELIQERKQKPVVIIGQPGSGKTTLMRRLAKKFMIANRIHGSQKPSLWERLIGIFKKESKTYHVVLHMNIRDIPNLDRSSLTEVIFNPSLTSLTNDEMKYGLQAILDGKVKIIMIFDGLDQASWIPEKNRKVGPWELSKTSVIFGNILMGHLLPNVPIVISSREHSVALLPKELRPNCVAALVGFSEVDAKNMYCQVMGENSEQEWDDMRKCNPGMHYMCLTPLFMIFYMLTKKSRPDDPPQSATEVMIRIIEIFVECENTRQIKESTNVEELIGNLKKMAFQGMMEQRVVFTNEDLEKFEVRYEDVSDVIIQVPGLSFLGHKILEGMYRFFFSHQTLQEILAALYAAEMDMESFRRLVDNEYTKSYWSVVRSFTSGILNNKRITERITPYILKENNQTAKSDYLIKRLQMQLSSQLSPTEILDICVALKEANYLESHQQYPSSIDFSNSSLTPVILNVLCSVLTYFGKVEHVSLVNCGIDDELLEEFANNSEGLGINVGWLDVRGNSDWKSVKNWTRIFRNISLMICSFQFPCDEENGTDSALLVEFAGTSGLIIPMLVLEEIAMISLDIEEIQKLNEYHFVCKIDELWIKPNSSSFDFDIWRSTFQEMPILVNRCFVEPPISPRGTIDLRTWFEAARCSKSQNVKETSMRCRKDHPIKALSLKTSDIELLSTMHFRGRINQLKVESGSNAFDMNAWRSAFQNLSFTIDHCIIKPPLSNEWNYVNAKTWIEAAKEADVDDISQILLHSIDDICLNLEDIKALNTSGLSGKIDKLTIKAEPKLEDWQSNFEKLSLVIGHCVIEPPRPQSSKEHIDTRVWITAAHHANVENVTKLSMSVARRSPLHILDMESLNSHGFGGEIQDFCIRPASTDQLSYGTWLRAFENMTFTVENLWIAPPRSSKRGRVDVGTWLEAAQQASRFTSNVKLVLLSSHQKISLSMNDIKMLNESSFSGTIETPKIVESPHLSPENWKDIGCMARNFDVSNVRHSTVSVLPELGAFLKGYRSLEIHRLRIGDGLSLHFHCSMFPEYTRQLEVRLDSEFLCQHPDSVGYFIANHKFKEVVYDQKPFKNVDVASFRKGLGGYQVDRMAVFELKPVLAEIVVCCQVKNIYIRDSAEPRLLQKCSAHANVKQIPRNEWNKQFLK